MKPTVSGHIIGHIVNLIRSRGGDVARVSEDSGLPLTGTLDKKRWYHPLELNKLMASCQRLYPTWEIPRKAGAGLFASGLARFRDHTILYKETPERLVGMFCDRFSQFHKSISAKIELVAVRTVQVEILFDNSLEVTQELVDFVLGVMESIPEIIELRRATVRMTASALAPQSLHMIDGRMVRVTASGELLEYPEPGKNAPGRARVIGRLTKNGDLAYGGIHYGADSCLFEIDWKRPNWLARTGGLTSTERLKTTSKRLNYAMDTIQTANERIAEMEGELDSAMRLIEAVNRFSVEAKSISSLNDLMHLAATHACTEFEADRAAVYNVQGVNLKIVSFNDPSDIGESQKIFASLSSMPIPLTGDSPEAEAVRTGRVVTVNNPWNNPRIDQLLLEAWKTRAYTIIPIQGKERVIGVILVDYYHQNRRIKTDDISRFRLFASTIGLAMEKVLIIHMLEEKVAERTKALQTANLKMTELYRNARKSDRHKGNYLANMSHELRTPLNSIIGFSKILLRGIDGEINERQQQDLQAINQSGTNLLELINDVLDMSKLEVERMELHKEHFDLNELVQEVVDSAQGLFTNRQINLICNIDNQLPILYADKIRIRQILTNLVSNAVKFTDSGSVTVKTKWRDPNIGFSVTDTGRGMLKDDIEKAFEEFGQIGGHNEDGRRGTGLGLTICKRLVELHNGRIWVNSTLGVGSTFYVDIPTAR